MDDKFVKTANVGKLIKLSAFAENTIVPTKHTAHSIHDLNFCHEGLKPNEDVRQQIDEATRNENIV